MVRTFDALRNTFDERKYEAWVAGRTGFPMVDACMRSLHATGWLNFRMRCMLVSFASYQLWLDWRKLTPVMARLFLDYEPGIHYPQFQMQSGTTGINANRIYSPLKQADDHAGADYEFIRKWVPELARVPGKFITEPHKMPRGAQEDCGCIIGENYPPPIVDNAESYRHAVSEFARVKAQTETKAQAAAVYEAHGSRKRPTPAGGRDDGGNAKRQASLDGAEGAAGETDDHEAPFSVETAASGRANCRLCGTAIPKGELKVCVSAWARGGRISANQHLACFVKALKVEVCATNRGKCKHSGGKFVKGGLRFGYVTTSADDVAWLCLESAAQLLPPMAAKVEGCAPAELAGFGQLSGEQRAAVEGAFKPWGTT